jgi:glycosyltransferase involved in cell wall biosynthesis
VDQVTARGLPAPTGAGLPDRPPEPGPRRKPITVLHVLDRMDRSGAELRAVALLRRLDPQEFRLVFCVTSGLPGALDTEIRSLGSEVYYCRAGWRFPRAFRRLLRRLGPDVVHAEVGVFSGAVLAVARLARVPRRVAHFRCAAGPCPDTPTARVGSVLGRGLIGACATDVLAVSESAMRGMWRDDWRLDPRCRVVYNGVELEPFGVAIAAQRRQFDIVGDDAGERVTLLHIARPDPVKNRARAIDILAALRARGVDARLRIVGRQAPDETAALTEQARRRGVTAAVEFTGERLDIPKMLVSGSLLLVTSRQEGLPSVVLEACAVGTPVLAADLPGIGEIARLLPGVTTLPLGAPDEVWADTARALTAVPPTLDERREAMRRLRRSLFTIENWARDITAVWSRQRPPAADRTENNPDKPRPTAGSP